MNKKKKTRNKRRNENISGIAEIWWRPFQPDQSMPTSHRNQVTATRRWIRQVKDEHSYVKKFSCCKNADVKGKITSGASKTVGNPRGNTVTTYEIQKGPDRWHRDVCIIHDIVQLEKKLGRPLTILDLLCSFDRRQIDSVSDILHWLTEASTW